MKKILFSLTYYTPYVSGLTVYVKRIAEGLLEKGINITILTSQHSKTLPLHSKDRNRINIIRVPYLWKISKGFIMPTYIWESIKAVNKNDVIFINLPQVEGFIVAVLAKLFHKKLYCIYHCDLVLPKGVINFLINKVVIFCNLISLHLADNIIVYTKEYAETSKHISKFKKKFIQILPPVYPLPIDEKYLTYLNEKFISKDRVGFAARIAQEKGLEYLIKAIDRIPNAKLFIAGPKKEVVGEEKYMKKIDKLLEKRQDKIIFLGSLNEAEMGAFYKFIDLLVVPSVNRTEAFGLVQAEAMFAGKPVIASDLQGVNFLIKNSGAGEIVKIKDEEDLKEKILLIKNNYQKYQNKTENINHLINIQKTINQFIKLI